jgi:cytoskeletal protein RodZ
MDPHRSDPVLAPRSSGAPATLDEGSATLGQLLRVAREQRRLTLSEVSATTNIPLSRLDAFERDDIGDIPLGMYQRAEIRAFADAVGVDPRVALAALERPRPASAPAGIASQPAAADVANSPDIGSVRDPRQIAITATRRTTAAGAQAQPTRARLMLALVALAVLVGGGFAVHGLWTPSGDVPHETVAAGAPSTSPEQPTPPQAAPPDINTAGRPNADVAPAAVAQPTAPSSAPVEHPNLRVVSEPSGARVTVDGIGWGQTPVTIRYLPPGAKHVRLTRDGYAAQEQVVQLSSDSPTTTLRVTLRRRR